MDLELSDEQRELRDVARQALGADPLTYARGQLEGGADAGPELDRMAQLGWTAVGLDEDDPFGLPGLALLCEQIGAALAPSLLADAAIAIRLLTAAGADERLLAPLVDGESKVALALLDADGDWDAATTTAAADGDAVSGTKVAVRHAAAADCFLGLARAGGEPYLFLLDAGVAGIEVAAEAGIDPSLELGRVSFDAAEVPSGRGFAVGAEPLRFAYALGAVTAAAEAVGAASAALDLAVAYALERKQFGRPIGSFQAVSHILADLHVLRETSWSTTFYAAAALDEGIEGAAEAASIAKAYVSRAARELVEGTMQVLGGIGFTWEHDQHLLLRRVLECEQRFGDSINHETRIGEQLAVDVGGAVA